MSQSTAVRVARPAARPASRPVPRQTGRAAAPRLRVVAAPVHARSRAGLVVGCLALLAVGLVGLLLLNVSLEKGAFVRRQQQAKLDQLLEQRQALLEELAQREAPQSLARRAMALGMVEAPNAAFVRTSDGRVLGVPSPGVAARAPSVTVRQAPAAGRGTTAGPAASPSPTKGTTAGTAKTSAKVTVPGKGAATTTVTSGTPAGQKPGAAAKAPAKASPKAGAPPAAGTRKVATKPAASTAGTP